MQYYYSKLTQELQFMAKYVARTLTKPAMLAL